jgi:hypothetical protein
MNDLTLMEALVGTHERTLPQEAAVVVLRQLSLDELHSRARRFISMLQKHDACAHDNGNWQQRDDQTVVRLPGGARAVVYHASGALEYVSGLAPAILPFKRCHEKEELVRQLNARAERLGLASWAPSGSELAFERLFQSKARGADRKGKLADTVLFRAIGAYRQLIGGLPVLGAASAALKLAGDGQVDTLSVALRPGAGEVLERARIIEPEVASRQIVLQLSSLLGTSAIGRDTVESAVMWLGYLDLGKRKPQRVLAPMYVAQVVLRHAHVRQAYVLAVRATEKTWLEAPLLGTEALATVSRSQACTHDRAGLLR